MLLFARIAELTKRARLVPPVRVNLYEHVQKDLAFEHAFELLARVSADFFEHLAVLAGSLTPEDQTVTEYFVRGTQPMDVSDYWQIPEPPTDLFVTLADDVAEITFTPPSRYMVYRLYREDEDGFSILLATIEDAAYTVSFSDPVDRLSGIYAYYVVPAHPALLVDGVPLCGPFSEKRWISVRHTLKFSP